MAKSVFRCAIAVLFLSAATFGDILDDGYWDGDSYGAGSPSGWWTDSSPRAWAGGDDDYSWAFGTGSYSIWTTETATLTGSCTVYVWAEASVDTVGLSGDYACAYAHAYGHVNQRTPKSLSASAYANKDDPEDSRGYSDSDARTGTFTAGNGVSCNHDASTAANIVYGGGGVAFSHACARAYGNLR